MFSVSHSFIETNQTAEVRLGRLRFIFRSEIARSRNEDSWEASYFPGGSFNSPRGFGLAYPPTFSYTRV